MNSRAISDEDIVEGINVGYLKFFGLWQIINHYRTTGSRNRLIKMKFLVTLLLNLPSVVCQYIVYFFIDVDIQKATVLNSHVVPCIQMYIRYIIFWTRLDSQCRLYDLIKKDFLKSVPKEKKAEASEIYRRISKTTNSFCTTILVTNVFIVILWVGFPCISVEYILHRTGNMAAVTGGRYKILGGWYPLPMDQTPYFEMIFIYEIMVVIWDAILLAVYACMFYQPLMCLYAHFKVLGHHIATLEVGRSAQGIDSDIYRQLYGIIQDHLNLIRYANELRKVYNPLITMTIGVGILMQIICIFQFLFGGVTDFVYVFKFFEFLAYIAVEVSMFCFGSSSLEAASTELQFAIYSSQWYRADVKYRRTAQMVMVRAKKGLTLTAVKMYPVNLDTMVAIFRFTYTVSALMSRMTE